MLLNRFWIPGLLLALAVSATAQEEVKKLSHTEALSIVVTRVEPEYPLIAKQLKLAGTVEVEAAINSDGSVENVRALNGNPVLTKAATTAVTKWKFKPITSNGAPAKAVATLSFVFKP